MKKLVCRALTLLLGIFVLSTIISADGMAANIKSHTHSRTGFLSEVEEIPLEIVKSHESLGPDKSFSSGIKRSSADAKYWASFKNDYYYDMLSSSQKALYDSMYSVCFDYLIGSKDISAFSIYSRGYDMTLYYLDYFTFEKMSYDDFYTTARVFLESNPQFYFAAGFSLLHMNDSSGQVTGGTFNIYSEYIDGNYRSATTNIIKETINGWLSQIAVEPNEYSKAKRIYQIVGDNLEYDMDLEQGYKHQTCATAILTGVTVCAGYSELYGLLANGSGLDCVSVTSNDPLTAHEWNRIRIGDFWYNLDITWGDGSPINSPNFWSYFAKSDNTYPFDDNIAGYGAHNIEEQLKDIAPGCLYDYENTGYAPSYSITYVGYGTGSYTYGGSVTMLNTPTKKRSAFDGWAKNSDLSGKKIWFIPKYHTGDKILYATWKPAKYTVSFNKNGATKGIMDSFEIEYNKSATLKTNTFTRTGYTFSGWNTKKDGTGNNYKDQASIKNLSDTDGEIVTLYAQWTPIKYNISFYGNGAYSGSMPNIKSRKYGKTYELPANKFKRTGYTFVGWSKSKNGKVIYKNKGKVKSLSSKNGATVKLYAKWIKNTKAYSIKYNLSGGKLSKKNPKSYTVATKTFKLKIPTKKGYEFVGWYTKKTGGTKVTRIAKGTYGNKTLYARWKKK